MKRLAIALAVCTATALWLAPAAQADFGLSGFDVRFSKQDGSPERQAGAHPFKMTTSFAVNYHEEGGQFVVDDGDIKDLLVEQIEGLAGSATAVKTCSTLEFASQSCGDDTAVGATAALLKFPADSEPGEPLDGGEAAVAAVYNLTPPPGVPVRLGFTTAQVPLVIDASLKTSPDYNVLGKVANIPQPLTVFGSVLELWGVPADPAHDFARGDNCVGFAIPGGEPKNVIREGELNFVHDEGDPLCGSDSPPIPFLTLPRACEGPLLTSYELDPWSNPGAWVTGAVQTRDHSLDPPAPIGMNGCEKLELTPEVSARPTADSAETASGLDFSLSIDDEGLLNPNPGANAGSDVLRTVVTLPEGVTANPSIAEGLGVCGLSDLERETLASAPGQGCPNASKIGTVSVTTPLLDAPVPGSVFLARPDDPATAAAENPFDTLIAFYIVLRSPELGVLVKVPAKVEPDPATGQLVTTVDDIPQVPFSRFDFHFREGQRAPLVTPPRCGEFTTAVELTPRANPAETVARSARFEIEHGPGGGPCPPAGAPPFSPGFSAGTASNAAATYSPFVMRITRADGEQDLTKFSADLPPGLVGRLAGVDKCPDAQIAVARAKSGRAEQAGPSCPLNSQIGTATGGAGVGSQLTYVPGRLYLAGPYNGAPLSVVTIVPAVAGPFDAGTVVVRTALSLDPRSARVSADGSRSDPIPHILKGIPLKVRDLRVSVDRSGFTLNPTSCARASTEATLFGSNLDLLGAGDDVPVSASAPFQAADCALLGFRPRLGLRLKGGTRRGAFPALRATYRPRAGHANLSRLALRFPRSAFIEQGHFRTICTRVQYAADACPPGSIYGRVRAFTPLLDEPLEGPVYLRSSNNNLPDAVFDLRGIVDVEAVVRIDSVKGGLRATVTGAPDVPVSRVVVNMRGGQKGLFVNSRNLCRAKNRASANMIAHSNKRLRLRPVVRPQCNKPKRAKRSSHARR